MSKPIVGIERARNLIPSFVSGSTDGQKAPEKILMTRKAKDFEQRSRLTIVAATVNVSF